MAAKNILSSVAIHSSEASVLLLDCPDIASILKTVEQNFPLPYKSADKAADTSSRAEKCPHQQPDTFDAHINYPRGIHFSVNNQTPVALARIVLLLILARSHSIDESEDVDFFWAVWSNSWLTHLQSERFQALSQTLAMHDFSPYLASEFNFPGTNDL